MNSTALQVLLYAIVAGASPLALASTLVLLHGSHARWRSTAFAVGVVLGQTVVCGLAFAVGAVSVPGDAGARDRSRAALELAVGIALLAGAWYVRYRRDRRRRTRDRRRRWPDSTRSTRRLRSAPAPRSASVARSASASP